MLVVFQLPLVLGCTASEPAYGDGSVLPPVQGPYASLAICTPAQSCPGPSCAANARGKPDGKTVDMTLCPTLELTFVGTASTRGPEPDLALHVTSIAGLTRVEASRDALEFKVVGFVNGLPSGTPEACRSPIQGNRVLVSLDACNTMTDVSVVRLMRDQMVQGALVLDAIEALSFNPLPDR